MSVILFIIFFTLYGGLNLYIGLWGWQLLVSKMPFLNMAVYWVVFSLPVICGVVGTVANKVIPRPLKRTMYLIGSYWLAAMTYFILIFLLLDVVRLLDRWTGFMPGAISGSDALSITLGAAVLFSVLGLMLYGTFNARAIQVTSYQIDIPKQAGSLKQLRIAMLSDTHFGPVNDQRQDKIFDALHRINPDLVLLSGDIVDNIEQFEELGMARYFRSIKTRYGIYVSFGNHEHFAENADLITERLNKAGIHVLRDSSVNIADSFYLVGREDKTYELISRNQRTAVSELVQGLNGDRPVIMLSHQPVDLKEAKDAGVDLMLSGHTHKGQFFPFNLVTSRIFAVDYGYLKKGSLQVIVTSGAGTWGPPIRIGSTSEVVDITVNFPQAG